MRGFWAIVSLSALLMSLPAAAKEHNVRDGGIYLGLDYFTGTVDTGLHDFLYLVPGLALDGDNFQFDIRCCFPRYSDSSLRWYFDRKRVVFGGGVSSRSWSFAA